MRICKLDVADQIWGRGGPSITPSTPPTVETFTVSPNTPGQPSISFGPTGFVAPGVVATSVTVTPSDTPLGICPNPNMAAPTNMSESDADANANADADADAGDSSE